MILKLKELREYEGLTQREVAKMLGVKRATYACWESEKEFIPLPRLKDFANLFHVSLDYIIGFTSDFEKILKNQEIDIKSISKNLKEYRTLNNLTQEELANLINTSQSNYSNYETGKKLITTTYALEFSKKCHYSLNKLLGNQIKTTKK